jgi:hypothetical protein
MDFIFGGAVKSFGELAVIIVSYDIACQWFVNLHRRMKTDWPSSLVIPQRTRLVPAIPAFHYPAHGAKNHDEFDPRLVKGNGTSDNEGPERIWGAHNALGNSTKTMGPEARHFTLDDNFSYWNWQKYSGHGKPVVYCAWIALLIICSSGPLLRNKFKSALADRNRQVEAHRGFTDGLPKELVKEWEDACVTWERGRFPKSQNVSVNPYATNELC